MMTQPEYTRLLRHASAAGAVVRMVRELEAKCGRVNPRLKWKTQQSLNRAMSRLLAARKSNDQALAPPAPDVT
jgi:hypothetical protein